MLSSRGMAGFAWRLLLLYGLLAAPWPGLKEAYTAYYLAGAGMFIHSFRTDPEVLCQPAIPSKAAEGFDAQLGLVRRGSPDRRWMPIQTRTIGFLPTVEVMALILATPIPWSRRLMALFWGLFLVHAFILLRAGLTVLYLLTFPPPWIVGLAPSWHNIFITIDEVFLVMPMTSFVTPILIWVAVTFRRSDLVALVGPAKQRSPAISAT